MAALKAGLCAKASFSPAHCRTFQVSWAVRYEVLRAIPKSYSGFGFPDNPVFPTSNNPCPLNLECSLAVAIGALDGEHSRVVKQGFHVGKSQLSLGLVFNLVWENVLLLPSII